MVYKIQVTEGCPCSKGTGEDILERGKRTCNETC